MAVFCRQLGLLYIQVPATGCSVIAKVLQEEFEGEPIGDKHADLSRIHCSDNVELLNNTELLVAANVRNPFDRFVSYFQRLKSGWVDKEYLAVLERKVQRDYASGKLSRLEMSEEQQNLSLLRKRLRRRERILRFAPFDSWYLLTMTRWARASNGKSDFVSRYLFPMLGGVDLVLKQERLGDAFRSLLKCLGTSKTPDLPVHNLTPNKRPYTEYYGLLARRHAERLHPEALARFGYRFNAESDDRLLTALTPRGQQILNRIIDVSDNRSMFS